MSSLTYDPVLCMQGLVLLPESMCNFMCHVRHVSLSRTARAELRSSYYLREAFRILKLKPFRSRADLHNEMEIGCTPLLK